jgi:hypothetical protein
MLRVFIFLGAFINDENTVVQEEITKRITSGNQAYFSHILLFKSNILPKRTKIKLYKTLVCPVITYGAETWTLKIADEHSLKVFEEDYLENTCGPIRVEGK